MLLAGTSRATDTGNVQAPSQWNGLKARRHIRSNRLCLGGANYVWEIKIQAAAAAGRQAGSCHLEIVAGCLPAIPALQVLFKNRIEANVSIFGVCRSRCMVHLSTRWMPAMANALVCDVLDGRLFSRSGSLSARVYQGNSYPA